MVNYDAFKSELTEGVSNAIASFNYQLQGVYQDSTVEVSEGKVAEVAGQNLGSNLVVKYNEFLQNKLGLNAPTTMYGKQAIKQLIGEYFGINIDNVERFTGANVPNPIEFNGRIDKAGEALVNALSSNVQAQLRYEAGKDEAGFKTYVSGTNAQYGLPTDFSGKTIDDVVKTFIQSTLKAEDAVKRASE